jgi:hypothetical protein
MSAVEEHPALQQSSNVGGGRSMEYEENRGVRRSSGQRGGRGRGRRPQTASGDVRVFDRGIPVQEPGSRVDGLEVLRCSSSFDVLAFFPRQGF